MQSYTNSHLQAVSATSFDHTLNRFQQSQQQPQQQQPNNIHSLQLTILNQLAQNNNHNNQNINNNKMSKDSLNNQFTNSQHQQQQHLKPNSNNDLEIRLMNEQNALFNKRLKYDMASSIQYLTNQLHHQQQQQQDINSVHHCLNPKKAYLDIIKSEMISPNDTNSTTRKTPPSEIYMNMPPNVPNRHQQTTPPTTTLNQATTLTRSTPKQQIKSLNRSIQENVNSNLLQTPSQSSHQQIDPPPSHFDNLALLQNLYKFKNVAEIFKLYSDDMQQAKSELEIDKHQLETDDQQKIHNNKNDFNEENVNSDNEYFHDLNRKTKKLRSFSISKTKKFKNYKKN